MDNYQTKKNARASQRKRSNKNTVHLSMCKGTAFY